MATTNLLRCSRWETCGKIHCEHYEPHFEKDLHMPSTGRSICFHDNCQGKPATCELEYQPPNWEV